MTGTAQGTALVQPETAKLLKKTQLSSIEVVVIAMVVFPFSSKSNEKQKSGVELVRPV